MDSTKTEYTVGNRFGVKFQETNHRFGVKFQETNTQFGCVLGEIYEVVKPIIPSDYGKITYNQDKTIIVS